MYAEVLKGYKNQQLEGYKNQQVEPYRSQFKKDAHNKKTNNAFFPNFPEHPRSVAAREQHLKRLQEYAKSSPGGLPWNH